MKRGHALAVILTLYVTVEGEASRERNVKGGKSQYTLSVVQIMLLLTVCVLRYVSPQHISVPWPLYIVLTSGFSPLY